MWHSAEKFPIIWNYADSYGETGTGGNFLLSTAAPRNIRTGQVTTQPQKQLTISRARESCDVPSDRFNVQFRLQHGFPTRRHNP